LYLRTFKQLLRSQQPPFDERQYGISSTYDLARQAQREGLFHIERNRQGILRIFPGERFPKHTRETEEITAPSSEISTGESVFSAGISEEIKEVMEPIPAVYAEPSVTEATPEPAAESESYAVEQTETVGKTAEPEERDEKGKLKAKPRMQRKTAAKAPESSAETSKPARSAQKTARKTQTPAKGKPKKEK
jgi:hypothetical protein